MYASSVFFIFFYILLRKIVSYDYLVLPICKKFASLTFHPQIQFSTQFYLMYFNYKREKNDLIKKIYFRFFENIKRNAICSRWQPTGVVCFYETAIYVINKFYDAQNQIRSIKITFLVSRLIVQNFYSSIQERENHFILVAIIMRPTRKGTFSHFMSWPFKSTSGFRTIQNKKSRK